MTNVVYLDTLNENLFHFLLFYFSAKTVKFIVLIQNVSEEEYAKIVTSNIVLELKDSSPAKKLLGVQVDYD